MNKEQLIQVLRDARRQDAREAALEILGQEAKGWWAYRKRSERQHLIDWNTGRHVSEFEANGQRYYVRSAEEGIGMVRYREFKSRILPVIGMNDTLGNIRAGVRTAIQAANTVGSKEPKLDVLFKTLAGLDKEIEATGRKWEPVFYGATMFIVRPDEDINEWSEALADEKIADWKAAGIHEMDFFFLCSFLAVQLKDVWQKLAQTAERKARESL